MVMLLVVLEEVGFLSCWLDGEGWGMRERRCVVLFVTQAEEAASQRDFGP